MTKLENKIDFKVVIAVKDANPNGDPLNGNRPRQTADGFGEISDVAIKRKIRNRFQDLGKDIFVQSNDRTTDGFKSLHERADSVPELLEVSKGKKADAEKYAQLACDHWIDVRSFGQLFAFKGSSKGNGVSVGVRGPVSIQTAVSISPIDVEDMQITKSVNSEPVKEGQTRGSDTMGMKSKVPFGVYVFNGSVNVQLAEKTGFSEEDAGILKESLETLFDNDASSARPEGSLEVLRVFWWKHPNKSGKLSAAKVHRSVSVKATGDVMHSIDDVEINVTPIDDVSLSIFEG